MRPIRILLFFLISMLYSIPKAQVPFQCSGQFFISHSVSSSSPTTLSELIIDPITQSVSFEPIRTLSHNFNAMGLRSTDLLIYAIHPNTWELYQIDANGDSQSLGIVDHPSGSNSFGGGITPNGKYLVQYSLGNNLGAPPALVLIDLEDPNHGTITRNIIGQTGQIYDLDFDPITGELYAVDSQQERLIKMNLSNGTVDKVFPPSPMISSVGGLFFDSFGRLYAYGAPAGNQDQAAIYTINKTTGIFSFIGVGPTAAGNDACSCPYTIKMQKRVMPPQGYPCDQIEYQFRIINRSGVAQNGVDFQDILPAGMTFTSVTKNPFGGLVTGLNTDIVSMTDMIIPIGEDTMIIAVEVGDLAPGTYANQSVLFDLPVSLGLTAISDDPTTITIEDSTTFDVLPFRLIPSKDTLIFCKHEFVAASIPERNVSVVWSNGALGRETHFSDPGIYTAEVTIGCRMRTDTFVVIEHNISATFDPDFFEVLLGDEIQLLPIIENTGNSTFFEWQTDASLIIGCTTCPTLDILANEFYPVKLIVTNDFHCSDSASVSFRTLRRMYIPNVFTPNNDGINDVFRIEGGGIQTMEMTIYNRWGGVVFDYHGPYEPLLGWDGRNEIDNVEAGVYSWNVRITFIDTFQHQESGTVTLLR